MTIARVRVPEFFYNYVSVKPVPSGTNVTVLGVDGEADTFRVNDLNFISSRNNVFIHKERGGTVLVNPAICFLVTEDKKEFVSCMVYVHTKRSVTRNGGTSEENYLDPLIRIVGDSLSYFDKVTGLQQYFEDLCKFGGCSKPARTSQIILPFNNEPIITPAPKIEQAVIKYI